MIDREAVRKWCVDMMLSGSQEDIILAWEAHKEKDRCSESGSPSPVESSPGSSASSPSGTSPATDTVAALVAERDALRLRLESAEKAIMDLGYLTGRKVYPGHEAIDVGFMSPETVAAWNAVVHSVLAAHPSPGATEEKA